MLPTIRGVICLVNEEVTDGRVVVVLDFQRNVAVPTSPRPVGSSAVVGRTMLKVAECLQSLVRPVAIPLSDGRETHASPYTGQRPVSSGEERQ